MEFEETRQHYDKLSFFFLSMYCPIYISKQRYIYAIFARITSPLVPYSDAPKLNELRN